MTVIIRTNGVAVRAYVGTKSVPVAPDGTVDPIQEALGQLRLDCEADRRRIMRDFRWWVEKHTDPFGRREEQWQLHLQYVHAKRQAEKRAAEAAQPLTTHPEGDL